MEVLTQFLWQRPCLIHILDIKRAPVLTGAYFLNEYKKRTAKNSSFLYYALSTFPARKQEVQTYNLLGVPLTLHLTDLTFDFHIRLDLL